MIVSSSCLTSQDNIDFVSNFPNLYLSDVTIGVSSCQIFFISSIRNNFHFVLIYFSCFRPGKSSWNLPRVREECDQRPPNHEIISWIWTQSGSVSQKCFYQNYCQSSRVSSGSGGGTLAAPAAHHCELSREVSSATDENILVLSKVAKLQC